MKRQDRGLALATLTLVAMILSACASASRDGGSATATASLEKIGSCSLGLPNTASDEDAITAMLRAESTYVVQQDIETLMRLWTPDGRISDAKHTPDNLEDDQRWEGTDAIRHRYLRRVFPGNPTMAQPPDLTISLAGEQAVVTGTTRIGNEVSPNGDRWQMVKIGGCWVIKELIFDLEPLRE